MTATRHLQTPDPKIVCQGGKRKCGGGLGCTCTAWQPTLMPADMLSTTVTQKCYLFRAKPSRQEHRPPHSIRVAVRLGFFNVYAELVFLVTSHVSIAHEIQSVVVGASGWGHEVKLHLERAGRGQRKAQTWESTPVLPYLSLRLGQWHSPWPSAAGSAS